MKRDENSLGRELLELLPVLCDGDPTDLKNKSYLSRAQHIQFVRFWNNEIQSLLEKRQ